MKLILLLVVVGFVFMGGCARQLGPPMICTTDDLNGGIQYYFDGTPILDFETETAGVSVSLIPTTLSLTKVLRVDLTILNVTETAFDFDPGDHIWLQIMTSDKEFPVWTPLPPYKIRNSLAQVRAEHSFAMRLLGALRSASYAADGDNLTANVVATQARNDADNYEHMSEQYADLLVNSMLRRNTVFPGELVTGYMYFVLSSTQSWDDIRDDRFRLTIELPDGTREMTFEIIDGEWKRAKAVGVQ